MELNGSFIRATSQYTTLEEAVPAPCIRKSFLIEGEIKASHVTIAALGFYRLFINGKEVTKGPLAPYISSPDHFVCCDAYDVSELLVAGENVIAVILGNGFQNNPGGYVWDFDKLPWRGAPAVCIELKMEYMNGTKEVIGSDDTFHCAPSAIVFDDLRKGEIFDATKKHSGWNKAGYTEDGWTKAEVITPPRGELIECTSKRVKVLEERKAVKITPVDDGYLFDFGLNDTGVCRLSVSGTHGQEIKIYHADHLKDGKLDRANITCDGTTEHQLDVYICSGEEEETYIPSFTYHGFQYAWVTGLSKEQVSTDTLTYLVYHPDFITTGEFASSSTVINQLEEITLRSALSNFIHIPTDCPHREKNGWTADAALACDTVMSHFDAKENYRLWLKSLRMAQRADGALPGIAPTGEWGFGPLRGPAWDCAIVTVPYVVYKFTGDLTILRENAVSMMRYLVYLYTQLDDRGLIPFGLGDYCPVDKPGPEDHAAPAIYTNTVMAMDSCEKSMQIFDLLDMEGYKRFAEQLYTKLRAALREHMIDKKNMIAKGNCQTSQAMAIYYKVFEPSENMWAMIQLLRLIHEKDDHMDIGVLGAKVIFHVLSDFGYTELALKMITRSDFPSYGHLLEEGATTLWEIFSRSKTWIGSKNHIFWGDISYWFHNRLAGINYSAFEEKNKLHVKPAFPDELNFAKGYFCAPEGDVTVLWERKNEEIELSVTVPEALHGVIQAPDEWRFNKDQDEIALGSGKWRLYRVVGQQKIT